MNTFKMDVSIEDFVCRLPAMFPYLEWNEDGSVEVHKATDSPYGCYGKVVDNMHMPQGVRLTNYIQVTEGDIPSNYLWGEGNTVRLSENIKTVFSTNASSFLRRVLWYSYQETDTEYLDAELVEELPIYVTDNDADVYKMVMTDPDGNVIGCDDVPVYSYYEKIASYSYYKREDIISPCTTYSYRTIIDEYYKYRNIVGKDNSFIRFVEMGIGLLKVDRHLLNLEDEEKYSEVPEFVYLSQVRTLLDEYRVYKKAYEHYNMHYVANGWNDTVLEKKSEKYIRMGGDNMTNWLSQLLQKVYDVADEYLCHSQNQDFPVRFSTNIMLNGCTNVVGLNTVYVNEFVVGKRYYDGDLLTYEGKTYVCQLDKYDSNGNNFQYVIKSGNLCELSGNHYIQIDNGNISYISSLEELESVGTTFACYDGVYYKLNWETNTYTQINVVSYITGVWDAETERYGFDNQHFVLLSEISGYDEWYDEENTEGDKYRFFEDVDCLASINVGDYVRLNGSIFIWDYTTSQYGGIDEGEESYYIVERTNSKLRDLRVFRQYVNEFGRVEEPGLTVDWLFYYKVNNITGKIVETDEFDNIVRDGDEYVCGEYQYDLHAYGNIISAITYNATDNTITFDYTMGGHLKAKYLKTDYDLDGNPRRLYSDFEFDENSKDGVHFVETYSCYDDSVASLGTDFEEYVNGDKQVMMTHAYKKFPFITVPVVTAGGFMNIEGVGVATVSAENNMLHANVVHEDWLCGLYYQPKVKSSISIDRGNGASFERHLRLGEMHTMEDMENYHNGGFYTISEN